MAIIYILLRVRRGAPDLDAKLAIGAPTSLLRQEIWPPSADALYSDSLLRKDGQGSVRPQECVADFRDWASPSMRSAYYFSKSPNETVRTILQDTLEAPTLRGKVLVLKGFVFRGEPHPLPGDDPPNKMSVV